MNADLVSQWLNLSSTIIGLVLILIFLAVVDKSFWGHWVTKTAFTIWCFRWVSYIFAYVALLRHWSHSVLLPILDFGSICTLLFAVVFMSGDESKARFRSASGPWLIVTGIILLAGTGIYMASDYIPLRYRLLYMLMAVAPSEIIANIGTMAMGWAFAVRYRSLAAYCLLILCLFYAFAQMPAYADVFAFRKLVDTANVEMLRSPVWIFFFLAPMKILIAVICLCLLYTPFVEPPDKPEEREEDRPARWPPQNEALVAAPRWLSGDHIPLHRNARRAFVALWGLISGIIVLVAGRLLLKYLGL